MNLVKIASSQKKSRQYQRVCYCTLPLLYFPNPRIYLDPLFPENKDSN